MKKITIAIDGHSSCGKSTMAKALAKQIGYIYVDTGAMYRVVTLYALRNNMIPRKDNNKYRIFEFALSQHIKSGRVKVSFVLDAQTNQPQACLNGEIVEQEIRGMEVSSYVSGIAALPFVREFLVQQQQEMGAAKGIVMDGRDIGTTVFPDAELKIFVTASAEVRAQRRYDELVAKGSSDINYNDILANVIERDRLDSTREVSPLRQADDALLLDNSQMTREEQSQWLLERFNAVASQG